MTTTRSTALITGASTGIGRSLARVFAREGHDVVVTARHAEPLQTLKQELTTAYKVQVHTITADLSGPDGAARLRDELERAGITVDILVNNAGVGVFGDFTTTDLADELRLIQLNVSSLVALTKYCLPGMVARETRTDPPCRVDCRVPPRSAHVDLLREQGLRALVLCCDRRRSQKDGCDDQCALSGADDVGLPGHGEDGAIAARTADDDGCRHCGRSRLSRCDAGDSRDHSRLHEPHGARHHPAAAARARDHHLAAEGCSGVTSRGIARRAC